MLRSLVGSAPSPPEFGRMHCDWRKYNNFWQSIPWYTLHLHAWDRDGAHGNTVTLETGIAKSQVGWVVVITWLILM